MQYLRIIIVDDEPEISWLIKKRLSKDAPEFRITTLGSAAECIEYLSRNDADCILTDYQMPVMSGMDMLAELRKQGNNTPVIFVTGQGNEEVAREAFKNGAYDYFTKEIGFAHFTRIINSIRQAVSHRDSVESRLKTEKDLVEERNKLQSILANIGDGISIQDKDLRILYQNPAHIRMIGDHIGKYCYNEYENQDNPCENCPVASAFATGRTHSAERCIGDPPNQRIFEINASPLRDSSGQIVAAIEAVREVTERKNEALKTKRTFESIIEAIKFGMIIVGRDRRVRHANRTALEMMDLTDEKEVVGKICHNNICPAEHDKCPILDLGQKVDLSEKFLLTKDCTKIPILKTVTPFVLDGEDVLLETFVDITALKQAQDEVARTRAFLQSVIDGTADPIMVIDKDYTVTLMNAAAKRLSPYVHGVQEGIKCHQISHGEDHPCTGDEGHECPLDHVMSTGSPITVTHKHRGANNQDVWLEITASPLTDIDGNIISVIESSRDITDRRKLENQRDDLYAMVAHDLRGSLTTILGYSEIITSEKAPGLDDDTRDMVAAIDRSAKRLSSMVEGYLTLSKLESGKSPLDASPTDIHSLVRYAADEYTELAAHRGLDFSVRVEEGLPRVMLDSVLVQRALSNLIENALNYTPESGKVTLAAHRETSDTGDMVVISVSDTGPGIAEDEKDKVFDKYYRSRSSSGVKGSGLGLAIVKAVAEAHGGSVELDSRAGSGSTFRLVFRIQE